MNGSAAAVSIARTSWLLALRDLKAQRARSILAPLWPGVAPVGQALIIFAIARTALGPRTPHYFSSLLLGCLVWAHLAACIAAALPSIVDGGAAVRRGGMPVLALPLGAVLRVSATLAPYLLVGVVIANIDSGGVHPGWLLLAVLVQLVAVGCVATAFAIGHVFVRSLRYGADLALQVGFYATPIILPLQHYPDSLRGIVRWLPTTALVE
ncbi:MAG: hypothetical protein M3P04_13575, partial [Actinomycetota bacterium]|nr:hypothetical protein [Actinomycetota bacterium]